MFASCFDACGVRPPNRISSKLDRAFRDNAKRVMVMTAELIRIWQRLELKRIPALAIKGPVTAHTLYDDPANRVFCDLDLLVPRESLADARKVLSECGYQPTGSDEIGIARFTELSLENAANGIHVDLHWALTPPDWYVSMPDGLWQRASRIAISGCEISTLGEEDTFLYLCIHGAKHGWSSLHWLMDLCRAILRSPGIAQRSRALIDPKSRAMAMLRLGLASAGVLSPRLTANSGIHIENRLNALAQRTVSELLSGTMREENAFTRLGFQWRMGGNRFGICRFILRRLFTPNQDDWNSLPIRYRHASFLVPWRLVRLTRGLISEGMND